MEGHNSSTEANTCDLVYAAISPIINDVMMKTGRCKLQLLREHRIIFIDSVTGGKEEFVVVDEIGDKKTTYVVIIETKWAGLGQGIDQCLPSMKDARDR